MSHFTYNEKTNFDHLSQGDLIKRTEELDKVIEKIHPYFFEKKEQYLFFQIITQSCDLVRRNGKCKAEHVTIAVVRDLDSILEKEFKNIGKNQFQSKFGFFDSKKRVYFQDFLKKLVNNNNSKYFYLHTDPTKNISKELVTTLRVNIALKSDLHYETLVSAKVLELKSEFKAKIGWLVGNLYSRVGTQDWVPDNVTSSEFDEIINEIIDHNFVFVDKPNEYKKLFKKKFPEILIDDISRDQFIDFVANNKLPKKKEILINKINEVLLIEKISEKQIRRITAKILQDPDIANMAK